MKRLIAIALLAVVAAGCSDILGPDTPDLTGTYAMIVIDPSTGANVAHSGSLDMSAGNYTVNATLLNGQRVAHSGTYSVRRAGGDHLVTMDPLGVEATYSNGTLHYQASGLEWVWSKDN